MGLFENLGFGLPKVAFPLDNGEKQKLELEWVDQFKKGDQMALKKLIHSLKPLIKKIIRETKPANDDTPDSVLMIKANTALPNIIMKYDPKMAQLNTFVYSNLKGIISNTIYEAQGGAHVSRPDLVHLDKIRRAKHEAQAEFGPTPSDDQIFSFVNDNVLANDRKLFDRINKYDRKSLVADAEHSSSEAEGSVEFKDQFANNFSINSNDHLYINKIEKLRKLAQERLAPQEYKIVNDIRFEGKTRIQVALSLGIPGPEVTKAIKKWDDVLKTEKHNI